jgi:cytochrome d ubiquinol oxidase subunit II
MTLDYALIWGGLIALAVLIYVLLDGFDLGIGILFPFLGDDHARDIAMTSVAPVWDGNETWLILGGGGLFAVFPLAYSILMSAMYAPVIALLLGLVLRGVAFEYRWRTNRGRFLWDWSFTIGSLTATLSQGIILGALVQGIPVEGRAYAGGWWDWLTPFSLATGVALVAGYGLLGSTWLIMKTEDRLQRRARSLARAIAFAMLALIAVIAAWTVALQPAYLERWISYPAMFIVAPVPLLLVASWFSLLTGLKRKREAQPFLSTLALFSLCYIVLTISFFPHLIPPSVSIWDAAGPDKSLSFLLAGAVILLPIILFYTGYAYRSFHGKVVDAGGYH